MKIKKSKRGYINLLFKEYWLRLVGRSTEAYKVMYERDALLPRHTPEHLLGLITIKEGNAVLDIGCGDGLLLSEIGNNGATGVGIDIAEGRVKKATEYGLACVGDVQKLPFKPFSFDIVIASEVLEHVNDYWKALKEIKGILKINGILIIAIPNEYAFTKMRLLTPSQWWKLMAYKHQHLHIISLDELKNWLLLHDFSILKVVYKTRTYRALIFSKKDVFHYEIVACRKC